MQTWLSSATAAEPAGFLLDHVADAVVAIDADFHIRYWNQAATSIYGWDAAEALGCPLHDLLKVVRYLDGSIPDQVLAQTFEQGQWRGQVVQRHRDGRELIIEAAIHLLRDATGAIVGMVAVNRDVTTRYALEREREHALAQAKQAQQRLALLADASLVLAHLWPAAKVEAPRAVLGRWPRSTAS